MASEAAMTVVRIMEVSCGEDEVEQHTGCVEQHFICTNRSDKPHKMPIYVA